MNDEIVVCFASEDEARAVYRLRYEVYVDEMGLRPGDANHAERTITDEWDQSAVLFVAKHGDQIVGALRHNSCAGTSIPPQLNDALKLNRFLRDFSADSLAVSSRFIIHRQWRCSQAAFALLQASFLDGRRRGVQFCFNYCKPFLISLYEQMGFRRYAANFDLEGHGHETPMVLILEDIEHFRRVKSVFLRHVRKMNNSPLAADWFRENFPEHAQFVNRRMLSAESFWQTLGEILHQPVPDAVPLFEGIDENDVKSFLKVASVHHAKEGEKIVAKGDQGHEMFVVLSGIAEAVGVEGEYRHHLRSLETGAIFGEMALFRQGTRTADVVAVTDCQLLVISYQTFLKAMETLPEATAKMLMNLLRCLGSRLNGNTAMLMKLCQDQEL